MKKIGLIFESMIKVKDNNFFWYFILLFFTFFIRLHTLQYEVISWDEATFIMAGGEILKGFLPYESMYEMKPPILYYVYAIPLYFHNSLESVRIFGIVCIFFSSLILYQFLINFIEKYKAALGALFFISIMNYYFWLKTSSEIICLPFLLLGFIFFINHRNNYKNLFLSGLFISVSTLIRLNIGYLALFLLIYLFFKNLNWKKKLNEILIFSFSGLIPLIILVFMYNSKNLLPLFIAGTFEVPLVYSSENSLLDGFINYSKTILKLCYFNPHIFLPVLISGILAFRKKSYLSEQKVIFYLFLLGVIFTTLLAGQGFSHHLIMLIPFLVIYILTKDFSSINYKNLITLFCALSIISAFYLSIVPNINMIDNNFNFRKNHKIRQISNDIDNINGKILALDYHLIYFYSKDLIPLKLFHTPAIVRKTTEKRLKPLKEINYFSDNFILNSLNKDYDYILCSTRICIEGRPNLDNEMIKKILSNYVLVKKINNFSKWEHTKEGNLLLYKKLKKSD